MLSSDFLFPRFLVVPPANPSNFSHSKCFSSRIFQVRLIHETRIMIGHDCCYKRSMPTVKMNAWLHQISLAALFSLLQLPIASVLVQS